MVVRIDLTGQTFGRWTVLNLQPLPPKAPTGIAAVIAAGFEKVLAGNLRNGKTHQLLPTVGSRAEHRRTHGGTGSKLYWVWAVDAGPLPQPEKQRCSLNYGGREVLRWTRNGMTFAVFAEDMGMPPRHEADAGPDRQQRGVFPR